MFASLFVILVLGAVLAFVYIGPTSSEATTTLESRVNEQLVIVGRPNMREPYQISFEITHIGTTTVTISEIRINNEPISSAGWTGDKTLDAGQTGTIILDGLYYADSGFSDNESYEFQFLTNKGNRFYCIVTYEGTWTIAAVIAVENVRFYTDSSIDYVEVILRNSGTGDAIVETVYIGTSSTDLTTQSIVTYTPSTQIVSAGSSLNVTIEYDWTEGTRYHFKIATESGLTLPFSEVA